MKCTAKDIRGIGFLPAFLTFGEMVPKKLLPGELKLITKMPYK
jgi:hypothetical protein